MKRDCHSWRWPFCLALGHWLVVAAALLPGCGGNEAGSKPAKEAVRGDGEESATSAIKRYETSKLPPVGEFLGPQDDGRIDIAPPDEWGPSRQKNYVVVFTKGAISELPRITVTAVDSPFPDLGDTTEANASQFAQSIHKQLDQDKKKIVKEKPKPILLGDRPWLRHVRQMRQSDSHVAVQSLQIVRQGRLYSIELFSSSKSDSPADMAEAVKKFRNEAYTVAAHARFPKESGAAPPAAETKPAEEKPDEKKSDEKKSDEKSRKRSPRKRRRTLSD